eukprot:c26186_g1_i1.p1 GENE.c26186_g1_i1~~c26186_g1_i1.p1  ORF type:complete len:329 (+),score=70.47 c26186_g1_i1:533-1519(+)
MLTHSSDPYAKVRYRDLEFKTHVIKRTLNPDWSETEQKFEFLFEESAMERGDAVVVEVWDWDRVGSDDFIGFASIALSDVWEAFRHRTEKRLGLHTLDGQADCGQVLLTLEMDLALSNATSAITEATEQFGVAVTTLGHNPYLLRNGLPRVFADAIDEVKKRGLEEQGIFRLSGSKNQIFKLRTYVNLNWGYDMSSFDCHTIAGLLKLFLREMSVPLLPPDLYCQFVDAGATLSPSELDVRLRELVHSPAIPPIHFAMLTALFELLHQVKTLAATNMMGAKNLATVFGPNILRRTDSSDSAMIADLPVIQTVTETLVDHAAALFDLPL